MDHLNAAWRKSSQSTSNGGACVELGAVADHVGGHIAVRDSKNPHGPRIVISRNGFRQLANAIKNG